ncbi:MAG: type II secretion system F family protein [Chloroflexota bacterium]
MNSSKSSPKPGGKSFYKFKEVQPFDLFYQLTYMSAMASAGISRSQTFLFAARSPSPVAGYFSAVNTLVEEMRYDYPEACRIIAQKAKAEAMKSFLLQLSDALRSGEPLAEFLAREAAVQSDHFKNMYERDLEGLKNWTDAFSSIMVSVALIVIIQLVSSMIYSMDTRMIAGLVTTAVIIGFFGAWIISRAAPQEVMTVAAAVGSTEQRQARRLTQIMVPIAAVIGLVLALAGLNRGWVLIGVAALLLPSGIVSLRSDSKLSKKDIEFGTLLRSLGGMAASTGTTLKVALTKIDLTSFPTLQPDLDRLIKRLQAQVEPEICWQQFGQESGSQLIREATDIFYSAVRLGGQPDRVGYLCSLFVATTSQLRAKRRIVAATFSGLTLVMQAVMAGLMVFVLEIILNFARLLQEVLTPDNASLASENIALPMAVLTPEQLSFLTVLTVVMIILLAMISTLAIVASDGGFKLKFAFYLALALLISGVSFLVVPPVVASIILSTQ